MLWTTGYLAQVASRVDQVALMAYNTGMPNGSWYGGYVARETELALRAVPARVRRSYVSGWLRPAPAR